MQGPVSDVTSPSADGASALAGSSCCPVAPTALTGTRDLSDPLVRATAASAASGSRAPADSSVGSPRMGGVCVDSSIHCRSRGCRPFVHRRRADGPSVCHQRQAHDVRTRALLTGVRTKSMASHVPSRMMRIPRRAARGRAGDGAAQRRDRHHAPHMFRSHRRAMSSAAGKRSFSATNGSVRIRSSATWTRCVVGRSTYTSIARSGALRLSDFARGQTRQHEVGGLQ
jgi:hypothetical protein